MIFKNFDKIQYLNSSTLKIACKRILIEFLVELICICVSWM